jgi:hypothetical protein
MPANNYRTLSKLSLDFICERCKCYLSYVLGYFTIIIGSHHMIQETRKQNIVKSNRLNYVILFSVFQ